MTYLGAPEDPTDVPAHALEEGTRIDGFLFNQPCQTLIVQAVKPTLHGKVRIDTANFTTGDQVTRFLRKNRPVTASGKI